MSCGAFKVSYGASKGLLNDIMLGIMVVGTFESGSNEQEWI
jgi:hypothetical protein